MKFFLLIILCLPVVFISCSQQRLTQEKFLDKFNKDWCECMEKQSEGKKPEEIVVQNAANCIRNLMMQYSQDKQLYDDFLAIIAAKNYDSTLSEYEKGRLFGRELGSNLIKDAVDNCVVYREALIQFKKYYIEKAKQDAKIEDKIETNEWIDKMQKELNGIDVNKTSDIQLKQQISNYYALLGLLYEYTDRDTLAIEQYDKAIQINPDNTNAIAFKTLLVKYKK